MVHLESSMPGRARPERQRRGTRRGPDHHDAAWPWFGLGAFCL